MFKDERSTELAGSGDAAADAYERGRPSYAPSVVDWLVPAGARDVLDLGAGTGAFTRLLAGRQLAITAVDPAERMLSQLRTSLPGVRTVRGTAEAIPLPDASVDAVVVAQAWHLVDPLPAAAEVARVLRPGGTLGVVWNMRDVRVPWVGRLREIIDSSPPDDALRDPRLPGPPFTPPESVEIAWSQRLDRAGLFDLVSSRSSYASRSEDERGGIRFAVDEMLRNDPVLAHATEWDLPYRTFCFRTRLA